MITRAIITILLYFFIIGAILGVFAVGLTEEEKETIGFTTFGLPSTSAFETFNVAGTFQRTLDFSNCNVTPLYEVHAGNVTCDTNGITTTDNSTNRILFFNSYTQNQTWTNTYSYLNPNNREFKIFIDLGYNIFNIKIIDYAVSIEDDGYHLRDEGGILPGIYYDVDFYPYSDANTITPNITTDYDWFNKHISVSVEGLGTVLECTNCQYTGNYYGGFEVVGSGFTLTNVNSNNYVPVVTPSVSAISSITGTIGQAITTFMWVLGFIAAFPGQTLSDPYMLMMNLILFKAPLIALSILIIAWLKPIGGT